MYEQQIFGTLFFVVNLFGKAFIHDLFLWEDVFADCFLKTNAYYGQNHAFLVGPTLYKVFACLLFHLECCSCVVCIKQEYTSVRNRGFCLSLNPGHSFFCESMRATFCANVLCFTNLVISDLVVVPCFYFLVFNMSLNSLFTF